MSYAHDPVSCLYASYRRSQPLLQADGLSLSRIGQLSPLLDLNRLCMKLMQDQRLIVCMNAHQKQKHVIPGHLNQNRMPHMHTIQACAECAVYPACCFR